MTQPDFTGSTQQATTPRSNTMNQINPKNVDVQFQIGRLIANLKNRNAGIPEDLLTGLPYPAGRAHQYIDSMAPSRDYIAEAAEAVTNGEDPDPILALAAGNALRSQVADVLAKQGNTEYIQKLNDNADLIIECLRAAVFEPMVEKIRKLHRKHGTQWDMATAVKEENFELAMAIKSAEETVGSIMSLHQARQLLHSSEGPTGGQDLFTDSAAWALEPGAFDAVGAATKLDERRVPNMHRFGWWIDLISAGYTPHFPTLTEWRELQASDVFTNYAKEHAEETSEAFSGSIRMSSQ